MIGLLSGASCWARMTDMGCAPVPMPLRSQPLRQPLRLCSLSSCVRSIRPVTGVFDRPGQWLVLWPLPEVVTPNSEEWC